MLSMGKSNLIVEYSKPLRARFRMRRIQPFLNLIESVFRERGEVRILDDGGTRAYWQIIPEETLSKFNVFVTVANFKSEAFEPTERFRFVEANGCQLSEFADNSFDIVHSNSVIEHVGTWEHMIQFANEVRRLAPRYWVQTPYFWFPIEPHCMTPFFHWLPFSFRVKLIMLTGLGNWRRRESVDEAVRAVESARLLDQGMLKWLFPDAQVRVERLMLLPKSIIMVKNGAQK